jgi:hypothetical protein
MTDHIPMGWMCPRCGQVWAPDVRECTCEPKPADTSPIISAAEMVFVFSRPLPAHLGFVETRTDV